MPDELTWDTERPPSMAEMMAWSPGQTRLTYRSAVLPHHPAATFIGWADNDMASCRDDEGNVWAEFPILLREVRDRVESASAPWDGRPLTGHENAPAHILIAPDGEEHIGLFGTTWLVTSRSGLWRFRSAEAETVTAQGWSYRAPLYPEGSSNG